MEQTTNQDPLETILPPLEKTYKCLKEIRPDLWRMFVKAIKDIISKLHIKELHELAEVPQFLWKRYEIPLQLYRKLEHLKDSQFQTSTALDENPSLASHIYTLFPSLIFDIETLRLLNFDDLNSIAEDEKLTVLLKCKNLAETKKKDKETTLDNSKESFSDAKMDTVESQSDDIHEFAPSKLASKGLDSVNIFWVYIKGKKWGEEKGAKEYKWREFPSKWQLWSELPHHMLTCQKNNPFICIFLQEGHNFTSIRLELRNKENKVIADATTRGNPIVHTIDKMQKIEQSSFKEIPNLNEKKLQNSIDFRDLEFRRPTNRDEKFKIVLIFNEKEKEVGRIETKPFQVVRKYTHLMKSLVPTSTFQFEIVVPQSVECNTNQMLVLLGNNLPEAPHYRVLYGMNLEKEAKPMYMQYASDKSIFVEVYHDKSGVIPIVIETKSHRSQERFIRFSCDEKESNGGTSKRTNPEENDSPLIGQPPLKKQVTESNSESNKSC